MGSNQKQLLSTLWIFLLGNYLYCDVLSLMDPKFLRVMLAGGPPGMPMTESFLLGAGILMEIPIAMLLVSRVVGERTNRWLNMIAGTVMGLVQIGSLFFGTGPTAHYWFYSAIEVATAFAIVVVAWKWRPAPTTDLQGTAGA